MPRAAPHPVDRATPVEAGVTGRAVPVDPDPVDPARVDPDPVDRAATDPADPDPADPDPVILDRAATDPETTDPAVPAAPETTDPAVPETTDPAVPADLETTGCAGLAVPAAHGMGMTSVATSTGPRGATDPRPGRWPATATGLEPTASAARGTVGVWPHQLLGLQRNSHVESRVQPVGLQLLRSLDPAVTSHRTRRPLRQSARRALCLSA